MSKNGTGKEVRLNSNPQFFLCLNTSFIFTNYQPIQRNASYNRAVRVMHRYCRYKTTVSSAREKVYIILCAQKRTWRDLIGCKTHINNRG